MKRLAMFALLGTALLVAIPGLAKKKPTKPVIETLEASFPGGEVLRFEIEECLTDQDIQIIKKCQGSITSALSLALIGNASAQKFPVETSWTRGVFDQEASRKPLAFAADAVSYGI